MNPVIIIAIAFFSFYSYLNSSTQKITSDDEAALSDTRKLIASAIL